MDKVSGKLRETNDCCPEMVQHVSMEGDECVSCYR